MSTSGFKRVPAIEKCFAILRLLTKSKAAMGITGISRALRYNKSTVFNIVHTLSDLGILEQMPDNKFNLGTDLYLLSRAAGKSSELIQIVHPYLEEINKKTKLSAFLGIRSGMRAVILDKVDSAFDIKISSEVGMRLPLLGGAGGRALLSQLPDREIERILAKEELPKFTPQSCVDKKRYLMMIRKAREERIAFDDEEYIEGIYAFAVPFRTGRQNLQTALWAVGLKRQVPKEMVQQFSELLKKMASGIEARFQLR
ncbi:MAG: hypothetical protein A2V65_02585 [Deltaproteobacteria bacterium RBG_13_49_15]|nr:MAG: hypothetical protein A2V65_02585 [Deltaproteobacteria bacterium RBG_13_49_15]